MIEIFSLDILTSVLPALLSGPIRFAFMSNQIAAESQVAGTIFSVPLLTE